MDISYLKNFCEDLGYETEVKKLEAEVIDYLSDGETISEEGKKLLTAVFVGDGEWNEPLSSWLIPPRDK